MCFFHRKALKTNTKSCFGIIQGVTLMAKLTDSLHFSLLGTRSPPNPPVWAKRKPDETLDLETYSIPEKQTWKPEFNDVQKKTKNTDSYLKPPFSRFYVYFFSEFIPYAPVNPSRKHTKKPSKMTSSHPTRLTAFCKSADFGGEKNPGHREPKLVIRTTIDCEVG